MSLRSTICRFLLRIFGCFPIKKNKIVFSSYYGKYYNDNPKYIFDAMVLINPNLDYVWLLDNRKQKINNGRVVKKGSVQSLFELATAKVWIDNCRKPIWMIKRNEQYYVQTWHAGIGLKAGEKACIHTLGTTYVNSAINDSRMANLFLANSDWLEALYRKYFWYDGEILKKGIPREDELYKKKPGIHEQVCSFYHVTYKTHFVLYAPTFRADGRLTPYDMDYKKVILALSEKTGFEWKIIIRLHPNIKDLTNAIPYDNDILNGTQYSEINDLILASDYLITDYSSCMFDGMLADKTVLIYASDIDRYATERGYLFKWEDLPFSIATTTDDLLQILDSINPAEYKENVARFQRALGMVTGGNASNDVAHFIMKKL